jgi:hypothetical protein
MNEFEALRPITPYPDVSEYRCLDCSCIIASNPERKLCSHCWQAACGKEDKEQFYDE